MCECVNAFLHTPRLTAYPSKEGMAYAVIILKQ